MLVRLMISVAALLVACVSVASAGSSSLHPRMQFIVEDSVHTGQAAGAPASLLKAEQQNWKAFIGQRQLSSSANSCQPKALYNRRQFKNVAGMVLWTYIQQIYYCVDNGYVTYFYRYRFGRTPSITPYVDWTVWEFDGNISTNCGNEHCFVRGGKARSRTAWTQGKFHACLVLDKMMCNVQMPELFMKVYGTGGFEPWTKGG